MNLVMLDIDGTLTMSYEYDREIFGLAIAAVAGCPPFEADLYGFVDKTSLGVTQEALRRFTGREPTADEISRVKRRVLRLFRNRYRESPQSFAAVPGAQVFLEHLRTLEGLGIAIATGCWRSEAMFKLNSSGLDVHGIPLATSDGEKDRRRIMDQAAGRARRFYACQEFGRIVYLGDGPWDVQASRSLGYAFIGIGPRLQEGGPLRVTAWHPDFLDLEAVLTSLRSALRS